MIVHPITIWPVTQTIVGYEQSVGCEITREGELDRTKELWNQVQAMTEAYKVKLRSCTVRRLKAEFTWLKLERDSTNK